MSKVVWIALFFSLLAVMAPAATDPGNAGGARLKVAQLPLSFEANQGQTDGAVKFFSRGNGYALFLTRTEAVFKLGKGAPAGQESSVLWMKLLGADGTAKIEGAERLPGTANYFIGNDPKKWRTAVPTYGKVNYRGIYPGVDAVFYGNQRELEYDFTVAPGVDPRRIALEFSGARPTLTPGGDVVLKLNGDLVTLHRPVIYQGTGAGKRAVDGSYTLAGNRVRFQIGPYDRSQPLVIDPVLSYLTYIGGSLNDNIGNLQNSTSMEGGIESDPTQGLAVDTSGNVYVTGYTYSLDFPVKNAYQPAAKALLTRYYTAFVTKLNSSGTALVYSTYLGGTVYEQASAIAVDASGSAYVAGWTSSPDFPTTPAAYMPACPKEAPNYTVSYCQSNGLDIGFLTKLSPDGTSLVYSTYLGSSGGHSIIVAVAVDSHGLAYVAGYTPAWCDTSSPTGNVCFPETPNALLPESLYDRKYTPNAYSDGNAFVTVFDAAGATLLYSTLFGDNNTALHNANDTGFDVCATGVAVDALGNFYLVGSTRDAYLPTTSGAFQPSIPNPTPYEGGVVGTGEEGFVAKFSPVASAGGPQLVYATYLGSPKGSGEQISAVAADANGYAYVTGRTYTNSGSFPVTPGAYQTTCLGGNNGGCSNAGFVAKIKPDGSGLAWATLLGDLPTPNPRGYNGPVGKIGAIVLDSQNNVYVAGESDQGFPQVDPVQTMTAGNVQAFVAELDPTGSTLLFSSLVGSATAGNQSAAGLGVDKKGNIYLAGNTTGPGLPVTPGAFQQTYNALDATGFIAKIAPFAVTSAASYALPPVAPGMIAVVWWNGGPDFSTATLLAPPYVFPLPILMGGVSATVTDAGGTSRDVPLFFISPRQINVAIPDATGNGTATITINGSDGTVHSGILPIASVAPGLFSANSQGTGFAVGQAWNVKADGSYTITSLCCTAGGAGIPINMGAATDTTVVVLYGTGMRGRTSLANVSATVGGQTAAVQYVGPVQGLVGLDQVNLTLPNGLRGLGTVAVSLTVDGKTANTLNIVMGQ